MRADRRIHAAQLGQAGPRRNNSHMELFTRIADFNRAHPIGCEVWIEDGSEHRHRATVVGKVFSHAGIEALVSVSGYAYQVVNLDDVKDCPA